VSKEDLTAQDFHILHYTELYNKWRKDYGLERSQHASNFDGYNFQSSNQTPSQYQTTYTVDSCTTSPDCNGSFNTNNTNENFSSATITMDDFKHGAPGMRRPISLASNAKPLPSTGSALNGTRNPMIVVPLKQSSSKPNQSHGSNTTLTTSYTSSNDDEEVGNRNEFDHYITGCVFLFILL
jgi:hypothetical protein